MSKIGIITTIVSLLVFWVLDRSHLLYEPVIVILLSLTIGFYGFYLYKKGYGKSVFGVLKDPKKATSMERFLLKGRLQGIIVIPVLFLIIYFIASIALPFIENNFYK